MSNILEKRNQEKPSQVESQMAYLDDADVPAPSMSLRDFIAILRRRKTIALYTFATALILGAVMTYTTKPQFQSSARILVEGKSTQVTISSGTDPLSSLFLPKTGQEVQTQVEVLRSPLFMGEAFKKAQVDPGTVGVDVKRVDDTDIVQLTATSTSREGAQKLIAVLPVLYQERTRQDRQKDVSAALEFARSSLDAQSEKLRTTEAALERFKNKEGVVNPTEDVSAAITAAAEARKSVTDAEARVTGLEAQIAALSAERQKISPFSDNAVTATNPQVQTLENELADLRSQREKLLFLYKPAHDEVRKVDSQIADLQKRLASTPKTITSTTRSTNPVVAQYDQRIADLRADLESSRASLNNARQRDEITNRGLSRFNSIARKQAELQRDLQTGTQSVTALSEVVTQLSLRHKALDAAGSPVTIIQNGGPAVQVAPRVSRNIVLALTLGVLLGCAAALLQESLDDHVRGEEEARRLVGAPVLAHFPELPAKSQDVMQDLTIPNPKILEGFRVLRTNVQFTLVGTPGRTIQVLSSIPSEGKSFTARNLAVAMALDGRKVLLVDADLHRPSVHRAFGLAQQPGLTHILVGRSEIEECMQETPFEGLKIIAAGDLPPNPAELLNSPAMDHVIERLQTLADIVIFDSPPMLATADGQVLASKVDGIIYVVELGAVPRSGLQRAFELLQQVNARVIGMVFNKVDQGEFPDVYAYYGEYRPFQASEGKSAANGKPAVLDVVADEQTAVGILNGVSAASPKSGPNSSN